MFAKLDPQAFARAFGQWMAGACEATGLTPIAVDGKSVRGSKKGTATECLLDWGERSFPTLLAPPALSQTLAPYRYRAYAGGVYVGVSSGDRQVYLLQGGVLGALGGLDGFLKQAACVAP